MTGRIEVIARVSGRRFWTVEQKLAMLRDAFGPRGSVRSAMERHDVTSGSLYTWRRNTMAGMLLARGGENRPAVIATAARMIYDAFGTEPRPDALLQVLAGLAASADLSNAAARPQAVSN